MGLRLKGDPLLQRRRQPKQYNCIRQESIARFEGQQSQLCKSAHWYTVLPADAISSKGEA